MRKKKHIQMALVVASVAGAMAVVVAIGFERGRQMPANTHVQPMASLDHAPQASEDRLADESENWTPVGHWANDTASCATDAWLIARTKIAAGSRACILRDNHFGRWQANCPHIGLTEIQRIDRNDGDFIIVQNPRGNAAFKLGRCMGSNVRTDVSRFDVARTKAQLIDRRIAGGELVRESVASADGVFLVRAWREAGEIVKIVAPIGGGDQEGRDRAFYFDSGRTAPFLIRNPNSVFVIERGRIVAWYGHSGTLISALVPEKPEEREHTLMAQASALRALAEPVPTRGDIITIASLPVYVKINGEMH